MATRIRLIATLLVAFSGLRGALCRIRGALQEFNNMTITDRFHRRLGCKSQELPQFKDKSNGENVVSFIAMGDTPYTLNDRYCLNRQLREIDLRNDVKFAVHVGDIKDSPQRIQCDKRLYQDVAEIFANPGNAANYNPKDILFVLGDNEWIDCKTPDLALLYWKKQFGKGNQYGFGELTIDGVTVDRQKGVKGVDRSENFSFFYNNILFIGLNIVGGKEFGDESFRLKSNLDWTRRKLLMYSKQGMKAAVVFAHAVIKEGVRKELFFNPFFALLREKHRDLPVMYLHGDGHDYCIKYPDPLNPNVMDVMVDEGGLARPLLVSVVQHPNTGEHMFTVDRRGGRYALDGQQDLSSCPIIKEQTWNVDAAGKRKKRLGLCESRCRRDKDCQRGLQCMTRIGAPIAPGCQGKVGEREQYCFDPTKEGDSFPKLRWKGNGPHPKESVGYCQGHCRKDAECKVGLKCYRRQEYGAIPGCHGSGRFGKNYCGPDPSGLINPPQPEEVKDDKQLKLVDNNPDFLLDECQGDCDDKFDCKPGLQCFKRNASQPVPGCIGLGKPSKDYCYRPNLNELTIQNNAYRLGECAGHCESDLDCNKGLKCYEREKFEPVPNCEGKGKYGRNYCYIP